MTTTLGDWLAAEPFSLAMSSGFFSFYAHTGMLDALVTAGLRPRLISGSSAGAMVGAAYACGLEMPQLADRLNALTRDDFWDPKLGAGLLAGDKFDRILRDLMPVTDASGCRVPIRISVYEIKTRQTRVIASGDLPPAVRASCCVPAMFHPVVIDGRAYWDGGIKDRPGLAGIPVGDRTLFHHIAAPAPWSRKGPPLVERPNMVSLVLDDLPRSNPFQLAKGRQALIAAREATKRALDRVIARDVVRLAA
ncbi:MAG: patatin-like phospholipase family protein [Kofleriaceae bacterium]